MATIKSYTSLEQSRKLAEILPLESADMYWIKIDDDESFDGSWETVPRNSSLIAKDDEPSFCWSLAALLNVLPPIEGFRPIIDLDINLVRYEGNYRDKLCFNENNLIDACYKMILKLHELKML